MLSTLFLLRMMSPRTEVFIAHSDLVEPMLYCIRTQEIDHALGPDCTQKKPSCDLAPPEPRLLGDNYYSSSRICVVVTPLGSAVPWPELSQESSTINSTCPGPFSRVACLLDTHRLTNYPSCGSGVQRRIFSCYTWRPLYLCSCSPFSHGPGPR